MIDKKELFTVTNNLTASKHRINDALELAFFHIGELTTLLIKTLNGERTEEEIGILSESFKNAYSELKERLIAPVIEENTFCDLTAAHQTLLACFTADLCRRICLAAKTRGIPLYPSMLIPTEKAPEKCSIAYVQSAVSDSAYRIFSKALPNASVIYPSDFASACEAVYDGSAGFCILPYETSDEGILSGFMRLIRKYELSPAMICSVKWERNITHLALLGRSQYAAVTDAPSVQEHSMHTYAPNISVTRGSASKAATASAFEKRNAFPFSSPETRDHEVATAAAFPNSGANNNKEPKVNGAPATMIATSRATENGYSNSARHAEKEEAHAHSDDQQIQTAIPQIVNISAIGSAYLKLTFDRPNAHTFAKLFAAADQLGHTMLKSDSIPLSWDEGRYTSEITFDISQKDICPLLLYIALELPECSAKSLYYAVSQ